eukprot:TRINITY_DN32132_c0_g3_i2.p1 TRINITY_DN32132_c0_g3~~TRINITY_DN32132_c0_g3_i2.p1  ORF type:complete len:329 (+),score=40.79 TRINITY_DN32132_c0_g3_i2:347-1333(+)
MNRRLLALAGVAGVSAALLLLWQRRRRTPRVSDLIIYPVKSCAEIRVQKATALRSGFRGDRILQVVDKNREYCTPRKKDHAKLFHLRCELVANNLILRYGDSSTCMVNLDKPSGQQKAKVLGEDRPDGNKEMLNDYGDLAGAWLQEATGIPQARLMGIGPEYKRIVVPNPQHGKASPEDNAPISLADEAPYLLTSTASLKDLNARLVQWGEKPVDMRRFRPNIVVDGTHRWAEDTWKRIRIGGVEFHCWQPCTRCTMTTIDRDTLERGPQPLNMLGVFHRSDTQRDFGIHMVPVASVPEGGIDISVGATVEVLEVDEAKKRTHRAIFP